MTDKKDIIEIPAIHIEKAIIKVVGDSPLIMHKSMCGRRLGDTDER